MKHPRDLLSQYLLGELDITEQEYIEKHLETCPSCLAEFNELSEGFVAMVENLPEAELSEQAFDNIQNNLKDLEAKAIATNIIKDESKLVNKRATWQSWVVAASLIIGLSGLYMAFQERQSLQQITQEQMQISTWLADSSVQVKQIMQDNEALASVLVLDEGKALFVIKQAAPQDKTYQLWGHKDGKQTSLGLVEAGAYEVDYSNYEAIGMSLEPKGGSIQPTRALGKVPVS